MKKPKISRYLCLLFVFLLLTGCISSNYHKQQLQIRNNWQNKYRLFEKMETEHFVFYVPKGDKVNPAKQEDIYKNITALFKIEPKEKIVYIKCKSREDVQKITGQAMFFAAAYTDPYPVNTIISYRQWDDHELVHIIQGLISRSTVFFEEGLAKAHQSSSYLFNDPQGNFFLHSYVQNRIIEDGHYISITKMLTSKKFRALTKKGGIRSLLRGVMYNEAGSFVRYLIDNYGRHEIFFQFLRLSNFSNSKTEIEEKFLKVYDLSIQEMEKQWLDFLKQNYSKKNIPSLVKSASCQTRFRCAFLIGGV